MLSTVVNFGILTGILTWDFNVVRVTFGASLEWPIEELQSLALLCWFLFCSPGGVCLGLNQHIR